ncbi:MAG: DUF4124 domain-containing protein [Rhodanobacteraceae bacterium]
MKVSRLAGFALAVVVALAALWYFSPQSLPAWLTRPILAHSPANPPLYKWRDAKGRLNVTDTPPVDRPYETLQYDPDANVVPGTKPAQ